MVIKIKVEGNWLRRAEKEGKVKKGEKAKKMEKDEE